MSNIVHGEVEGENTGRHMAEIVGGQLGIIWKPSAMETFWNLKVILVSTSNGDMESKLAISCS